MLTRARRYLDAGANCVDPVRLSDPGVARRLDDHLDAPVNANLGSRTALADLTAAVYAGCRSVRGRSAPRWTWFQRIADGLARVTPEEVGPDTDDLTRVDGVSIEAAPGEMVRHNAPGPSSNQA